MHSVAFIYRKHCCFIWLVFNVFSKKITQCYSYPKHTVEKQTQLFLLWVCFSKIWLMFVNRVPWHLEHCQGFLPPFHIVNFLPGFCFRDQKWIHRLLLDTHLYYVSICGANIPSGFSAGIPQLSFSVPHLSAWSLEVQLRRGHCGVGQLTGPPPAAWWSPASPPAGHGIPESIDSTQWSSIWKRKNCPLNTDCISINTFS